MSRPSPLGEAVRAVLRFARGALALAAAAFLGGCSVIGFTAGAVSDGRDYSYARVELDSLRTLRAGDEVKILPKGREYFRWSVTVDRYDPGTQTLYLHEREQTLEFPRDRIREISKRVPRTGKTYYKWIGLGLGLAVDTALLIAIASTGGFLPTY